MSSGLRRILPTILTNWECCRKKTIFWASQTRPTSRCYQNFRRTSRPIRMLKKSRRNFLITLVPLMCAAGLSGRRAFLRQTLCGARRDERWRRTEEVCVPVEQLSDDQRCEIKTTQRWKMFESCSNNHRNGFNKFKEKTSEFDLYHDLIRHQPAHSCRVLLDDVLSQK